LELSVEPEDSFNVTIDFSFIGVSVSAATFEHVTNIPLAVGFRESDDD
jgi:hypothetical protein